MANIFTTLHPENSKNDDIYPNIKARNIPENSIELSKLTPDARRNLFSLKPSGTDTSSNILSYTSNKGIYVATNNGHWYYWNGTQYVDGGQFQAAEIAANDIKPFMLDKAISLAIGNLIPIDSNNWVNKQISSSGSVDDNDYFICNENYIDCNISSISIITEDNSQYGIQILCYDSNKNYIEGVGWGIISTNRIQKLNSNCKYFRFNINKKGNIIRTTDLNKIGIIIIPNKDTVESIDNNEINLNNFANIFTETPYDVRKLPLWIYSNFKIKRIDVVDGKTEIDSSTNLLSDYIEIDVNKNLYITPKNNFIYHLLCYDSNKNYIGRYGGQYWSVYKVFTLYNETKYATTKYIRMLLGTEAGIQLKLTDTNNVGLFNGTLVDDSFKSYNLRVMTMNVGRYSWGRSPYYLTEEQYQKYYMNYRKFLGKYNCDILCLQENGEYMDIDHQHNSNNVLYNALYPYSIDYGYTTSVKSRIKFNKSGNGLLSNNRWYSYCVININNRDIIILSAHLSVDDVTKRAQEMNDILNIINDYNYAIIGMDSNIQAFSEINVLTNAGLKAANGGYFGWIPTYYNDPADYNRDEPIGQPYYLDNIFTKGNIIINNINVINEYNELTTDHLPVVTELTIY